MAEGSTCLTCTGLKRTHITCIVVYYESRKRELKTRPIYKCRCDERLKTKSEKSAHLVYTGLLGELEHVMGEYVFLK
jgi:hypothetical protein